MMIFYRLLFYKMFYNIKLLNLYFTFIVILVIFLDILIKHANNYYDKSNNSMIL